MGFHVAYYFAVFAVMLRYTTIVSVRGQCTIEGCENVNSSMGIAAETCAQQLNVEAFRQLGTVLRNFQAIDQRRLQEHDIYIKQGQSIHKLLNESFIKIKNQLATIVTSLQAHDRRLQEHDISIKNQNGNAWKLPNGTCDFGSEVCDCSDIKATGQIASGIYEVCAGLQSDRVCFKAFCDMETANRTSLVFQRRMDGSVNFFRTWVEYKEGFGDLSGEFWLGNEMLYLLTSKRNYKLRIDLEDWEGNKRFTEYKIFSISSSIYNYTLTVSGYSGNAGHSLAAHNGQQFSTKDAKNDKSSTRNCAAACRGAWWYHDCYHSNLNGIYHRGNYSGSTEHAEGVQWNTWPGLWYSLKSTEMKLVSVA